MKRGYVKLWRKLRNSNIFAHEGLLKLWILCLTEADHEEKEVMFKGLLSPIKLMPGQFITGRDSLHRDYHQADIRPKRYSPENRPVAKTLYRWLVIFKKMQNLSIKNTNKYSIITIINWERYQKNVQQMSNKRPTSVHKQEGIKKKGIKDYTAKEEKTPLLQERKFYKTKKGKKLQGKKLSHFNDFWTAFDYRRGKAEAADVWLEIEKDLTDEVYGAIIAGAKREASARPGLLENDKIPKMAQGWLSGRRWEDEPPKASRYM